MWNYVTSGTSAPHPARGELWALPQAGFKGPTSDEREGRKEQQLAGSGITSLPARLLAGMDALTTLHLWGNRLREFPVRFFRDAANLRELILWSNELGVLEST